MGLFWPQFSVEEIRSTAKVNGFCQRLQLYPIRISDTFTSSSTPWRWLPVNYDELWFLHGLLSVGEESQLGTFRTISVSNLWLLDLVFRTRHQHRDYLKQKCANLRVHRQGVDSGHAEVWWDIEALSPIARQYAGRVHAVYARDWALAIFARTNRNLRA